MEGSFVQHSVRVLQELNKQRETGQFCDATLSVGSRVFKAHWSVLACCSSFFQSLYDGASGKIILPETFAAEVFALLLDFFYTGHLGVTPENRERLLEAARELRIPEAVQLCQGFKPASADDGVCAAVAADAHGGPAPDADLVQERSPQGSPEAPGRTESPRRLLLRGRAPKTNGLSDAGEVKGAPECRELKRPLKREVAEDPGAGREVACGGVMC